MNANLTFVTGGFLHRNRLILVNDRIPRTEKHCALCGRIIEKTYVRDLQTRLIYFFCVSTNLTTGTLAVHRDGPLVDALHASISIPGLLPPVIMRGDVHVDGGVMNWLPVDVPGARRGTIIAVDVASDPALVSFEECNKFQAWRFLGRRRKFPPIVAVLLRAATVSGDSLTKMAHDRADILFKPPLENVDLLDWQACDQAIETGYRYAVEKLEQLGKPVASCTQGISTGEAL